MTHRFGTMAQQAEGVKVWVVGNRGRADLELRRGGSTCACTVADLAGGDEAVVKPGDSIEVRLTWETREGKGRLAESAVILTNDPGRPEIRLAVEGTVEPTVVVVPAGPISFMNLASDEPHRRRVAVFSPGRPGPAITSAACTRADLLAVTSRPLSGEELEAARAEAGDEVVVELKQGAMPGYFRDELVITTDHPSQPELRVPVWGRVVGPIDAVPGQVELTGVSGPEGGVATIMLRVQGREDTTFAVAEVPGPLKVDIEPAGGPARAGLGLVERKAYRMTVTVPAGTPPGQIAGQIALETDHPRAARVTIPVYVTVVPVG